MALSPQQFKERIERAKRSADIKAVLESTGAQAATSNANLGQYTYHAPYREDSTPSLTIYTQTQTFTDFGQTGASGDVIELARLIHGHGDKNAFGFFEAVKWLEGFSGRSVAPQAKQPPQRPGKLATDPMPEGERFTFVKAAAVTAKTHPNQLDYIMKTRRIGLPVASRHLWVVTYRDNAAPFDDLMRGNRYGIGSKNDAGGFEVRAAQVGSKFKTALGGKDITTYAGEPGATIGDIFEGQFDMLTYLEMSGQTQPSNPTIVLNSGRLARRAGQLMSSRPDWQTVQTWRIWQHADQEGDTVTQMICEETNTGQVVGTMHHLYKGYNDLNQCWTEAPDGQRATLKANFIRQPAQSKLYNASAGAEVRRSHEERIKKSPPKLF